MDNQGDVDDLSIDASNRGLSMEKLLDLQILALLSIIF